MEEFKSMWDEYIEKTMAEMAKVDAQLAIHEALFGQDEAYEVLKKELYKQAGIYMSSIIEIASDEFLRIICNLPRIK